MTVLRLKNPLNFWQVISSNSGSNWAIENWASAASITIRSCSQRCNTSCRRRIPKLFTPNRCCVVGLYANRSSRFSLGCCQYHCISWGGIRLGTHLSIGLVLNIKKFGRVEPRTRLIRCGLPTKGLGKRLSHHPSRIPPASTAPRPGRGSCCCAQSPKA